LQYSYKIEDKEYDENLTEFYKTYLAPFEILPNDECKRGLAYMLRTKIAEISDYNFPYKLYEPLNYFNQSLNEGDNLNFHKDIIYLFSDKNSHKSYLLYPKEYIQYKNQIIQANDALFDICPFDKKPLYLHESEYSRKSCGHTYHLECIRKMIIIATGGNVIQTEKQANMTKNVGSACAEYGCMKFSNQEIKEIFGESEYKRYKGICEENKKIEFETYKLKCCNKEILKCEMQEILKNKIYAPIEENKEEEEKKEEEKIVKKIGFIRCPHCKNTMHQEDLMAIYGSKYEWLEKSTCSNCLKIAEDIGKIRQYLNCNHNICDECMANCFIKMPDKNSETDLSYPVYNCLLCNKEKNLCKLYD